MRIGFYAPWANGDMAESTGVLKYVDELFPGSELFWFTRPKAKSIANPDMVKFHPRLNIRMSTEPPEVLWSCREGHRQNAEGHALSVPPGMAGRLTPAKNQYESLRDLDLCYFAAPWANCDLLQSIHFVLINTKVYPYLPGMKAHPDLRFSDEEDAAAEKYVRSMSHPDGYNIMMETRYGSGQSFWNDGTTQVVMSTCRRVLGDKCNFIFSSMGSKPNVGDAYGCDEFTVRQCLPVYNRCSLFLGVSSSITVSTCSWSASPLVPRIDCVTNPWISTNPIARGKSVTCLSEQALGLTLENMLPGIRRT